MPKVLITESVDAKCLGILDDKEILYDVKEELSGNQEELERALAGGDYQAVIFRSQTNLKGKEAIAAASKGGISVLGRAGTDPSNVNIYEATEADIQVLTAAGANAVSTAEHTITLMLAMSKNIALQDRLMRSGTWDRNIKGVELAGKTIGIIGFGRVGSEVAKRARLGLEMRVIAYDPFVSEERIKNLGAEPAGLEEIFKSADYITVHIPGSGQNMNLIGEKQISMLKPTARLLNVARGGIINEKALYDALKNNKIAGAALDVYEKEPYKGELMTLDNIIVTPHLAGTTDEAQEKVGEIIAERVANALLHEDTTGSYNDFSIKTKPYRALSEILGRMHTALLDGNLSKVGIGAYAPTVIDMDMLKSGCVYGLLSSNIEDITLENASKIAAQRGEISIIEDTAPRDGYGNGISVWVQTNKGKRTLQAVLLSGEPRLIRVDDIKLEGVEIGEHFSFLTYEDLPGQVNKITMPIWKNKINIATSNQGRDKQGGTAIFALNTDSPIPPDVLKSAADAVGAYEARTFHLLPK